MLEAQRYEHPITTIEQVITQAELLKLQEAVKTVHVERAVQDYIVTIVEATRNHADLYLGASPRGSLALYRLSQARALLDGRDFALPDDVKDLVYPALGHRLILSSPARIRGKTTREVVDELLGRIPVPGATPGG